MASPETFDIPIGKVVGRKGDTGNGIASIALLSTSGLNKTYRITMTDETTFDFVVTDGNGITGATFDAQTNALTLTFDNGTSFTTPSLKGTKGDTGNGISRIEKTRTEGLVDTYTVTYTNGQTYTYTVTNGADGVSPEVTVTPISGGHTVEIEDADGVKTFDVLDGEVTEARLAEALATKAPVILETASGAIASFDDGADGMPVKKLAAQIEPVQDLHGYDHPWPAGGGKNKLHVTAQTQTINGVTFTVYEDGTVNVNGTASETTNFVVGTFPNQEGSFVLNGCPTGGSYTSGYSLILSPFTDQGSGIAVNGGEIVTGNCSIRIVSGATVSNQLFKPMIRLATEADATFTPYENICPISGWTGAEINDTGINVWDEEWEGGVINSSTGANAGGTNSIRTKGYIPVTPRTPYYIKTPSSIVMIVCAYDRNKQFIKNISYNTSNRVINTSDDNIRYIRAAFIDYGNVYNNDISINYPATDTEYHPYTGNQISVTFPSAAGTVYGGTLTLNPDRTGELVVDRAKITKTWGEFTSKQATDSYKEGRIINVGSISEKRNQSICDKLNYNTSVSKSGLFYISGTDYIRAFVPLDTLDTDEFTFVYYTSPQTYTLTESEVSGILTTLYGTNNIWADTGDVEVTYPADTKLFIEKLTQPTEDDMTADHAISAGTFFQLGNTLYLATAAIAAGAIITPGTNATKLSLADALNQLNT